jgi:integrase
VKTIFRWATRNHKIASNPAEGLSYQAKIDPRKERQDFSEDDMRLILTECRKAANPVVRISNLIASFSGGRLAEIVEANKAEIRELYLGCRSQTRCAVMARCKLCWLPCATRMRAMVSSDNHSPRN